MLLWDDLKENLLINWPDLPVDLLDVWGKDGNKLVAYLQVPGVKQADLSVAVEGIKIIVQATTSYPHKKEYKSTLYIPRACDPDSLTAQLQDGILTLSLTGKAESKLKQIPVSVK